MAEPAAHRSLSPHLIGLLAAGPFALAVFSVALIFGTTNVPLVGENSMEYRVAVIALFVAPIAYGYGALRYTSIRADKSWFPLGTRTLALILGLLMSVGLVMPILAEAFTGYLFTKFWGSVFLASVAFVLAYASAAWGARRWVGDIVYFAVFVVAMGILMSAINSGAPEWWTAAISSLGTAESLSYRMFELTCMTAGAMLLLAVPSMKRPLGNGLKLGFISEPTLRIFPRVMGLAAVLLFLVGAFPMDGGRIRFAIHNTAGIGFGAVLLLSMAVTKKAFPGLPQEFIWYSWVFAALSAIAAPLYTPIGFFSLAEIEVVIFGLEALWGVLLMASFKDAGLDSR